MGGLISPCADRVSRRVRRRGLSVRAGPIGKGVLVDALGAALPSAGRHRLYFDFGTRNLGCELRAQQQRMDEWLRTASYREG